MRKHSELDFRVSFAQMDPQAVISREELAALLSRTPEAVSLLAHRGRLPRTAFPGERKACWFVQDIRNWLDEMAKSHSSPSKPESQTPGDESIDKCRRTGRPRGGEQ
jgi:hypothetical protein